LAVFRSSNILANSNFPLIAALYALQRNGLNIEESSEIQEKKFESKAFLVAFLVYQYAYNISCISWIHY
jgi:hypothetical protein